jgi:uncharacterized protein YeaO (DUF488 family)
MLTRRSRIAVKTASRRKRRSVSQPDLRQGSCQSIVRTETKPTLENYGHRSVDDRRAFVRAAGRKGGVVDVRLKRAYEPAVPADGYRVLIDRLWPRGLTRERAKLDAWERELPPSTALRQWFGHDPRRFEEFRRRYVEELRGQRPRLAALRRWARDGTLTLVYSARDSEHNDAVVLAEVLRRGLPRSHMRRRPARF